jgi:3-dehydroquinate dehydratase II
MAKPPSPLAKPIFVLNGPNLNRLGVREPSVYGSATLKDIEAQIAPIADELAVSLIWRQSNHEGELIDWLHEADAAAAAVVFNPGGYTHTSVALRDAVLSIRIPVIEVHLSNPMARETFRHTSFISPVARGVISGFGAAGYGLAVRAAADLADQKTPPHGSTGA